MKAIGIDFGGTTVKMGLYEGDRLIERIEPLQTGEHDGPEALIDAMAERVTTFHGGHPEVGAVGVGVPGFVTFHDGHVHKLTNVSGWVDVALRDLLAERTGLPVTVENDANCMAYAEWRLGAGRGSSVMLAITLGTGVGGGLVLGGKLHRGASSGAGELGQVSIDWQGRMGAYDNPGCLEKYVGHREITGLARQRYLEAGVDKSAEDCGPRGLEAAARAGDAVALDIWDTCARMLAAGLGGCCWLLSPDRLVIGGGVANAGDVLFGPLRRHLEGQLHPLFWEALEVVPARFGNEAGMLGAAILAADEEAGLSATVLP